MNNEPSTRGDPPELRGVTIIYDDRETGLRARRFADRLCAAMRAADPFPLHLWRGELLELREVARDCSKDADGSEFVILSTRGDAQVPMATRDWLEAWLPRASKSGASLVALFDPARTVPRFAQSNRCYLRRIAAQSGVSFFAHSPTSSAPVDQGAHETGAHWSEALEPALLVSSLVFAI